MGSITIEAQNNDFKFRITERSSESKIYLNVSRKEDGNFVYETARKSIDECKEFALEKYKISLNSWHEMKFQVHEAEHEGKLFKIEEDYPEVGAYLYIYENGKGLYDYLQNNIEMCKEFALEDFQVPLDKWVFKGYK